MIVTHNPNFQQRHLGKKMYELNNHLGNVLAVVTDKKIPIQNGTTGNKSHYVAHVVSVSDYYPFGALMPGRNFNANSYTYGYQGQLKTDEISGSGNHIDFKYRGYDPRTGRFWSVDPLAKDYPWNSPYAFSENRVIDAIELEGLEKVLVFDQQNNPNNRRVYTAKIYVVTDDDVVHGPYKGSSYPNYPGSKVPSNTLKEGTFNYNNKFGHKGGSQKGLNIIDNKGNRTAPGTSPKGKNVKMFEVNVHSGQDPKGNNGKENRGSQGCPTVSPEEAGEFFENFDFSGKNGTTGKAEGTITIFEEKLMQAKKCYKD